MKNCLLKPIILTITLLLAATGAWAKPRVDWEAINPNLKDAKPVTSSKECMECHKDYIQAFSKTIHAKAYKAKYGKVGAATCEVCHGPLSKHMEKEDAAHKAKTAVSFKEISSKAKNAICLQCHEKGITMNWRGSTHEMSDLSCDKCHYVMDRRSKEKMFIREDSKEACFQCHKDKRAQMRKTAHMPLLQGKMTCGDCHNPHGGPGPSLLKSASVNETCNACHRDKRGPVVWEHPPVRENCANCHDPHGSNFTSMLKLKIPYLCQTCHSNTFHPSTMYDSSRIAGGSAGASDKFLGKGCVNCHSLIHGSNHPSGARFTR